jgi:septum site-determining protein MinC
MEIKGIKDGILVNLENQDWSEAKKNLIARIQEKKAFFEGARMVLDVGNTLLRAKELGELRDVLSDHGVLLWAVLSQSLVTQETAQTLGMSIRISQPKPAKRLKVLETVFTGEPAVMVQRTMRSGYKVAYQGHVVVLGDVNPGAEIIASGNIIVWGRLRGTAHAGADGDENCVVCALDLQPMQLRIASRVATTPKRQGTPEPEMASIKDDHVIAETWQYH